MLHEFRPRFHSQDVASRGVPKSKPDIDNNTRGVRGMLRRDFFISRMVEVYFGLYFNKTTDYISRVEYPGYCKLKRILF